MCDLDWLAAKACFTRLHGMKRLVQQDQSIFGGLFWGFLAANLNNMLPEVLNLVSPNLDCAWRSLGMWQCTGSLGRLSCLT